MYRPSVLQGWRDENPPGRIPSWEGIEAGQHGTNPSHTVSNLDMDGDVFGSGEDQFRGRAELDHAEAMPLDEAIASFQWADDATGDHPGHLSKSKGFTSGVLQEDHV